MTSLSGPTWETCKENAAPLASGRNVAQLNVALQKGLSKPTLRTAEIETKINFYESTLKTAPSALDPIVPFLTYLNYLSQNCPNDTRLTFLLLERTTRQFLNFEQFHNDVRYVRIAITYADKTTCPKDVFKFLAKKGVGKTTSLFWIAWAYVCEKTNDFKTGDKIFKKATEVGAQPKKMLEQRYSQFKRRMAREFLRIAEEGGEGEEEQVAGGRAGLTTLKSRGRNGAGSGLGVRTSNGISNNNTNPNGLEPTFDIYVEEISAVDYGFGFLDESFVEDKRELVKEDEGRKENLRKVEAWNGGGLARANHDDFTASSSSSRSARATPVEVPPSEPAFSVFCDPSLAPPPAPKAGTTTVRSLRQRLDSEKPQEERLAKDPLRYLQDEEKAKKDVKQTKKVVAAAAAQVDSLQGLMGAGEETKRKKEKGGFGFLKRLVGKDGDDIERCFEESRKGFKFAPNSACFNLEPSSKEDEMDTSVDSSKDDVSMTSRSVEEREADETVEDSFSEMTPTVGGRTPNRNLFASDQKGMESEVKRKAHRKSISGPIFFNELTLKPGADTSNTSYQSQNKSLASAVSEKSGLTEEDEDQTINTKLAMADLGLMFGSPSVSMLGGEKPLIGDETANLGVFTDLMEEVGVGGGGGKKALGVSSSVKLTNADILRQSQIQEQKQEQEQELPPPSPEAGLGFSIFEEESASTNPNDITGFSDAPSIKQETPAGFFKKGRETDADLSRITEPFQIFQEEEEEEKEVGGAGGGFEIFTDDASKEEAKPFEIFTDDAPKEEAKPFEIFTDDAPKEEAKPFEIFTDDAEPTVNNSPASTNPDETGDGAVIEWDSLYASQLNSSVAQALKLKGSEDKRNTSVPQIRVNSSTTFMKRNYSVKMELGRGVWGVVFLVEDKKSGENLALKVQKGGVGSLAWEFLLSSKMKKRGFGTDGEFMLAQNLQVFSDGAAMLMCTPPVGAKFLGVTVLTVANTFLFKNEPVPELMTMYYVSKVLKVVEEMHDLGGVLHCDIKADNFILAPGKIEWGEEGDEGEEEDSDEEADEEIECADVKLIDFGRAIDLETAEKNNPIVGFFGEGCAEEDMEPPAMLEERPWKEDIDTYGVVSIAHVLLFGSHLAVSKDVKGRWRQTKSIRRYWEKDIWSDFFDTLLNSGGDGGGEEGEDDECVGVGFGSGIDDLRRIRKRFEGFMKGKKRELRAMLNHQNNLISNA